MRAECIARPSAITIASTPAEVESALALVYDAYLQTGLIHPNYYGVRATPYHLSRSTNVLVAKQHGEVICTATLVFDGRRGLPMETVFGDEVRELRKRGVISAEVSCLADRRSFDGSCVSQLTKLMCFAIQCAEFQGVQELMVAVHPRHAGFYVRYFGAQVVSGVERSYDAVRGNPAVALSLDIPRLRRSATPAHRRVFGHTFQTHQFWPQRLPHSFITRLSRIVDETYYSEARTPAAPLRLVGAAKAFCREMTTDWSRRRRATAAYRIERG